MRFKTTSLFAATAATLLLAGSTNAATIVYNFDGDSASVSSNGLAGDGVTADNVTTTVSNGSVAAGPLNNRLQRDLFDQGTATYTFVINIGATAIDLTGLSFTDGIDSLVASNNSFSQWDVAISTGSASPATVTSSLTSGVGDQTSKGNSLTLSGLTGLSNTSVTFTFVANYGVSSNFSGSGNNNSRFAYIDDLTFTGSAVPEPGSLALLGLGGLLIGARRRR